MVLLGPRGIFEGLLSGQWLKSLVVMHWNAVPLPLIIVYLAVFPQPSTSSSTVVHSNVPPSQIPRLNHWLISTIGGFCIVQVRMEEDVLELRQWQREWRDENVKEAIDQFWENSMPFECEVAEPVQVPTNEYIATVNNMGRVPASSELYKCQSTGNVQNSAFYCSFSWGGGRRRRRRRRNSSHQLNLVRRKSWTWSNRLKLLYSRS